MVDGFRYPLATRHPHVSTTGGRQPDRSRQGGLRETPKFCASPFLGRYSGRQVMVSRHTRAYVERTQDVHRSYAERTQAYAVRGIDPHVFLDCLFVAQRSFCPEHSARPAVPLPEVRGVRYVHFYVFRGPGVYSSGHTGSLPGCAEQSVLFPGGAKVKVQVDPTACRFLKAPQPTQHNGSERGPCFQRGSRIGKVRIRLGVTSSLTSTPLHGHSTLSHQLVNSCSQVTLSSGSLVWWSPVGLLCVEGGVKSLPNKEPVQERGGEKQ